MWHDSCICVTWLIRMCDVRAFIWGERLIRMFDSTFSNQLFILCMTLRLRIMTFFSLTRDMTLAYAWHDLFVCVMCLVLYGANDRFVCLTVHLQMGCSSFVWRYVFGLVVNVFGICMFVRVGEYVCVCASQLIRMSCSCHTYELCATLRLHVCYVTHAYVRHNSFIQICDMTHSHV